MAELLVELFSSRVRAAVLGHLLPRPHLGLSLTDLSRRLELPISSLQHECYKLERIGVLRDERVGIARLYRPDPDCPLLPALTALISAATGREATARAALDGLPGLTRAFLAGPVPPALPTDPPHLVLVGDLSLDALDAALERVAVALGMPSSELELAFFRPPDWQAHLAERHPFVRGLLAQPRLTLVDEGDAAPAAVGARAPA